MDKVAQDFFKRRDENSCYVTGDGNVYRPRHKELAHQHAREAGVSVEHYTREGMKKKEKPVEKTGGQKSTGQKTAKKTTKKDS